MSLTRCLFLFSSLEEEGLCVSQPPQGHQQKRICLWQLELNPSFNPSNTLTWWQPQGWQHWREGRERLQDRRKDKGGRQREVGASVFGHMRTLLVRGCWRNQWAYGLDGFEVAKLSVDFCKSGVQCGTKRCWRLLLSTCQQLCEDSRLAASHSRTGLVHFQDCSYGGLVCF